MVVGLEIVRLVSIAIKEAVCPNAVALSFAQLPASSGHSPCLSPADKREHLAERLFHPATKQEDWLFLFQAWQS